MIVKTMAYVLYAYRVRSPRMLVPYVLGLNLLLFFGVLGAFRNRLVVLELITTRFGWDALENISYHDNTIDHSVAYGALTLVGLVSVVFWGDWGRARFAATPGLVVWDRRYRAAFLVVCLLLFLGGAAGGWFNLWLMQRELQINLHRYGRYLPTEPLMLAVIQAYSARYGVVLGIAVFLTLLAWGRHLCEVGRTLRIPARDERLVRG